MFPNSMGTACQFFLFKERQYNQQNLISPSTNFGDLEIWSTHYKLTLKVIQIPDHFGSYTYSLQQINPQRRLIIRSIRISWIDFKFKNK